MNNDFLQLYSLLTKFIEIKENDNLYVHMSETYNYIMNMIIYHRKNNTLEKIFDILMENRTKLKSYEEDNILAIIEKISEETEKKETDKIKEKFVKNKEEIKKILTGYSKRYGGDNNDIKLKVSNNIGYYNSLEDLKYFLENFTINKKDVKIESILKRFKEILINFFTDINSDEKIINITETILSEHFEFETEEFNNIIEADFKDKHIFYNSVSSGNNVKRIHKEYNLIKNDKSLINDNSSVYFSYDPTRIDLFKFMIIGPKNTPYEGGFFIFDGFLNDYPNKSPSVKFLTTGGGKVRFNPNLYNCGKVCLSLLGTWNGPGWDKETSTIYQIILSIQCMIFVEEPYYNEPGHTENKKSSDNYSDEVRKNTKLYAIDYYDNNTGYPFDSIIKELRTVKTLDDIKIE